MKSSRRLICLLLGAASLSGCSGLHLYDAQKDAIAKAAKTSFVEANLPELAKREYVLNQLTLDQQLIVVRKHTLALRDAILVEVLDRQEDACPAPRASATPSPGDCQANDRRVKGNLTWGFFERKINERLGKELGIDGGQDALGLLEVMRDIQSADAKISGLEAGLKSSNNDAFKAVFLGPELDRMKNTQKTRRNKLTALLKKTVKINGADVPKFKETGVFRRLLDQINNLEEQRQGINDKTKAAKSDYDYVKGEYDKAIQAGKSQVETDELVAILQQAERVLEAFIDPAAAPAASTADKQRAFDDAVAGMKATVDASKNVSNKSVGDGLVQLAGQPATKRSDFEKKIKEQYRAAAAKGNTTAFAKQASYYLEYGIDAVDAKKIDGLDIQAVKDLAAEIDLPKIRTQMEAVNQLVSVYVENNGTAPNILDPSTNNAVHVAKTLRSIADHYATTKSFPHASGLLLEAERLRIEYEMAKQRVARGETHIELLAAKLKSMMQEIRYLSMAQNILMAAANKLDPNHDWGRHYTSLVEDYLAGDGNLKLGIAKALYFYACSWTLGRVAEEEADYRVIALNHESALDSAVAALQQWNNLILVPLTGIAAFHGSGVTTDDIAKFFQAAGVGAIAGGVNR